MSHAEILHLIATVPPYDLPRILREIEGRVYLKAA